MVSQKYRWDFIGLSTDDKPTSETSDKVVNGSTYYCSDTSKLYVYCDGTWYERKPLGGGGGGTSDFNDLSNRPKYNGTDMTGSTNIPEVVTYSDFTGTDGTTAGAAGLVPAPATTDAGKFLKADGTWDTAGSVINVVQDTGTSTADVMSQNAVTSMIFADPGPSSDSATRRKIRLGPLSTVAANQGTAIGANTTVSGAQSIAISGGNNSVTVSGRSAIGIGSGEVTADGAISLGVFTPTNSTQGKIEVGTTVTWTGYNNSNYRLLTGLYDGQNDHDAATKGQLDSIAVRGAGAPTTSTVGEVGQLYEDGTNGALYQLKSIDITVTPNTYNWEQVGGSGGGGVTKLTTSDYNYPTDNPTKIAAWTLDDGIYEFESTVIAGNTYYESNNIDPANTSSVIMFEVSSNVTEGRKTIVGYYENNGIMTYPSFSMTVNASTGDRIANGFYYNLSTHSVEQSTGSNTKHPMSQNATTSMVFADPSTKRKVAIGDNANNNGNYGVVIGANATKNASNGIAIGNDATVNAYNAVAIGAYSRASTVGEMNIGTSDYDYGYNNSKYRLLSGVYDGQNDHDAATVGQLKMGTLSATPTGTTAGFPGRLYTYDSGGGTYEVYLCVHDNGDDTYVWKQVSLI